MKKVLLFTNIAPHYRKKMWSILLASKVLDFHFIYGVPLGTSISTIDFTSKEWDPVRKSLHHVRNYRLGKVVFWQSDVLRFCLQSDYHVAIFLGDMYIISNWMGALIARLRGKRVLFWGHGLYGNESFFKRSLRKLFFRLAHEHLLYGNYGRSQLVRNGFQEGNLHVVYNSLDYDRHVQLRDKSVIADFYRTAPFFKNKDLPVLVFIGRLTPEKRLDLLIEAVIKINRHKAAVNLIIVGDGAERPGLERLSSDAKDYIHFYGSCYSEEEIGKLLANADLCVSPGNVGLTAIHSLSFGTPVCTNGDMRYQMPEVESIQDGVTGILFNPAYHDDLQDKILKWISGTVSRDVIRKKCYETIDSYYNPYYQLKVFEQVLNV